MQDPTTPLTGAISFADNSTSRVTFMGRVDGSDFPILTLYADGRVTVSEKLTAEGTAAEVLRLITELWGKTLATSMGVDGSALAMDALSPEDFVKAMEVLRSRRCLDCGRKSVVCHCEDDE